MSPKVVPVPCTDEFLELLEKLKKDTQQTSNVAVIRLAIAELAKSRGIKVGKSR